MSDRARTYLEYWRDGEAWKATEPDADHEIVGRGPTAPLAAANYCEAIEAAAGEPEVVADD